MGTGKCVVTFIFALFIPITLLGPTKRVVVKKKPTTTMSPAKKPAAKKTTTVAGTAKKPAATTSKTKGAAGGKRPTTSPKSGIGVKKAAATKPLSAPKGRTVTKEAAAEEEATVLPPPPPPPPPPLPPRGPTGVAGYVEELLEKPILLLMFREIAKGEEKEQPEALEDFVTMCEKKAFAAGEVGGKGLSKGGKETFRELLMERAQGIVGAFAALEKNKNTNAAIRALAATLSPKLSKETVPEKVSEVTKALASSVHNIEEKDLKFVVRFIFTVALDTHTASKGVGELVKEAFADNPGLSDLKSLVENLSVAFIEKSFADTLASKISLDEAAAQGPDEYKGLAHGLAATYLEHVVLKKYLDAVVQELDKQLRTRWDTHLDATFGLSADETVVTQLLPPILPPRSEPVPSVAKAGEPALPAREAKGGASGRPQPPTPGGKKVTPAVIASTPPARPPALPARTITPQTLAIKLFDKSVVLARLWSVTAQGFDDAGRNKAIGALAETYASDVSKLTMPNVKRLSSEDKESFKKTFSSRAGQIVEVFIAIDKNHSGLMKRIEGLTEPSSLAVTPLIGGKLVNKAHEVATQFVQSLGVDKETLALAVKLLLEVKVAAQEASKGVVADVAAAFNKIGLVHIDINESAINSSGLRKIFADALVEIVKRGIVRKKEREASKEYEKLARNLANEYVTKSFLKEQYKAMAKSLEPLLKERWDKFLDGVFGKKAVIEEALGDEGVEALVREEALEEEAAEQAQPSRVSVPETEEESMVEPEREQPAPEVEGEESTGGGLAAQLKKSKAKLKRAEEAPAAAVAESGREEEAAAGKKEPEVKPKKPVEERVEEGQPAKKQGDLFAAIREGIKLKSAANPGQTEVGKSDLMGAIAKNLATRRVGLKDSQESEVSEGEEDVWDDD